LPFKGPPKFAQIWEFWFENKPSGNPGSGPSQNTFKIELSHKSRREGGKKRKKGGKNFSIVAHELTRIDCYPWAIIRVF
jgi:hypothetical protein